MRNYFILVFCFISLNAYTQCQIKPAKIGVSNMGSFYRFQKITEPIYTCYPYPDSASLRVTFICPSSGLQLVRNVNLNEKLDYKLSGIVYIASSTIWWKKINNIWVKKSQSSNPTICMFGLNPVNCFQQN